MKKNCVKGINWCCIEQFQILFFAEDAESNLTKFLEECGLDSAHGETVDARLHSAFETLVQQTMNPKTDSSEYFISWKSIFCIYRYTDLRCSFQKFDNVNKCFNIVRSCYLLGAIIALLSKHVIIMSKLFCVCQIFVIFYRTLYALLWWIDKMHK